MLNGRWQAIEPRGIALGSNPLAQRSLVGGEIGRSTNNRLIGCTRPDRADANSAAFPVHPSCLGWNCFKGISLAGTN
jgi:hypothetical protein